MCEQQTLWRYCHVLAREFFRDFNAEYLGLTLCILLYLVISLRVPRIPRDVTSLAFHQTARQKVHVCVDNLDAAQVDVVWRTNVSFAVTCLEGKIRNVAVAGIYPP